MAVEKTSSLLKRTSEESDLRSVETQEALSDYCGPAERKSTGSRSSLWNSRRSVFFFAVATVLGLSLCLARTGSDDSPGRALRVAGGSTASIHESENRADHMEVELCMTPYITKDADTLRAMEQRQMVWLHNLLDVAKARQANPGRGWDVFNEAMMPVLHEACVTERIGSAGDGGKFVCGMEHLASLDDCVVYSIGSDNVWDFEEAIVTRTGCHVETFDCTVRQARIPPSIQDHVHFEPLCLGTRLNMGAEGNKDAAPETELTTLKELRNTSKISLLKMDIEGSEWGALRAMLRKDWDALPEQISMEVHIYGSVPMEVALFAQQLHMAGYRVVSKEDNPACQACTEFTLVRVYCPRVTYPSPTYMSK